MPQAAISRPLANMRGTISALQPLATQPLATVPHRNAYLEQGQLGGSGAGVDIAQLLHCCSAAGPSRLEWLDCVVGAGEGVFHSPLAHHCTCRVSSRCVGAGAQAAPPLHRSSDEPPSLDDLPPRMTSRLGSPGAQAGLSRGHIAPCLLPGESLHGTF